jgi:hypothetical protein
MSNSRFLLLALLALPPALRADETAASDEKVLQDNKVGTDGKGLHEFFRKRTPTPDDQAEIDALVAQLGERSYARRQRATEALTAWGPAAFSALKKATTDQDIEIVRRAERIIAEIERGGTDLPIAAVRQLARKKITDATTILIAYAPNADDDQVTDAVLAALLVLSGVKVPDPVLVRAAEDHSPVRRAAAAHVLGRHPHKAGRDVAAKLLADPAPLVRFRAAEALLLARQKPAIPVLIDLLGDAPTNMRWQVEELLARLPACIKGEPSLPLAPGDDKPESLSQWREAWAGWWNKHETAADLSKLEERPAFQNLTLVPEMHAHKVWEFGPDGKTRWELARDLQCPIDAQVIPGGRILVAEIDGHRITERDRNGRILWQHPVKTPIYCRRMSNGNTFISTNHACFVVTAAGKEVFRYSAEGGFFIHSIQQLPNHHIVCISMDGDVREIGPDGKVIRTIPLQERGSWSGIEGLPGNRYLCVGGGKVREIDAVGKVLWRFDHPSACFATRLPSGNTLVVDNSRGLIEVTREGKIVWKRDLPTNLWRVHRR